jgi:hypothetical protein
VIGRGRKVECRCDGCGQPFTARVADRARGWGRYCSKRCKAIEQEKRTGQYATMRAARPLDDLEERGWDAHKGALS